MTNYNALRYANKGIRVSTVIAVINALMAFTFPIIFISVQGEKALGYYLTLSAIPSLIIFVERGKINSASVLMSKLHTKGEIGQQFRVFSLLLREIYISTVIASPVLILLSRIIHPQTRQTLIFISLICLSGILGLTSSCLEAFYRGIGKFTEGIKMFTACRITEFIGLVIAILLQFSFIEIAFLGIMGRVIGIGFFIKTYLKDSHKFEKQNASLRQEYLNDYRTGANANLSINIGLIFQNQISILLIEKILGLSLVAEYSILKTFSGLFKTLLNSILSGTNSAFTISFQNKSNIEIKKLNTYLNRILKFFILLSLPTSFGFYAVWIRFQGDWPTSLDYGLFACYLIGTLLDGVFMKNMSIANSINQHSYLSKLFLITNIVATLFLFLLLPYIGLFSYPLSFFLLDLVMIPKSKMIRDNLVS